jgi:hypothetical protein
MKKIFLLFLLLFVFGCNPKMNYINGHKIIRYGTTEFENFEKNAKIKKEEAWEMQKEITGKNQVLVTQWLFFVIDKNYIFTTIVSSKKRQTELTGISINSETGEIKHEKSGVMIKYKNVYNGDNHKFPFELQKKYRN